MTPIVLSFTTRVAAPPETVWTHATTLEGITWELGPWLLMTVPFGETAASLEASFAGRTPPFHLGRSWILLFGVLPVDWDDLGIVALEPGRRFHERSTLASMRRWEHERTIAPEGTGALVSDRLTFEPRWFLSASIARLIIGTIFRHRHRRIARRFG